MTNRDDAWTGYAGRMRREAMGRTPVVRPLGGNAAAHRAGGDGGGAGFRNDQGASGGGQSQPRNPGSHAQRARDAAERGAVPRFDGEEPRGFSSAAEAREAAESYMRGKYLGGG